ncbi:MAG TPA: dipeptide epimerase, partial [Verrucomicrobiae bacterium]
MNLVIHSHELRTVNPWRIANGASGGAGNHGTVIVELTDGPIIALGEGAPSALYGESVTAVREALQRLDARRLSFTDIAGSMAYLESVPALPVAAQCALNLALLDGGAKHARQPLHDFLGLGFRENRHVTSFSIGIDTPDVIREKVLAAADFPILKLKVGDARDRENFAALRAAAPDKPVRVDANEGWQTKET